VSLYPFNEAREQIDTRHCPAPFCGCDLTRVSSRHRVWRTPVMFADERIGLLSAAAAISSAKMHLMFTCDRDACVQWARLRAEDLRGGPDVDPEYVAFLWASRPRPLTIDDAMRELIA
jgi:hypothetical protein